MSLFKNWRKRFHDFYFGIEVKDKPLKAKLPKVEIGDVFVFQGMDSEKTGKEFNEHEDRIPYGAKEEITTGFKFLNMRTANA